MNSIIVQIQLREQSPFQEMQNNKAVKKNL